MVWPFGISLAEPHPTTLPNFAKAGIESFAASDREKEDAAILALTLEALRETGLEQIDGGQFRLIVRNRSVLEERNRAARSDW